MTGRASVVWVAAVGVLAIHAREARAQCNNALTVTPPTLATLPVAVVGTPYTAGFSASGSSSGSYYWQGPTASAPMYGLYVQTTGVAGATNSIVGTPTAAGQGMFSAMLAVTDWTTPGQCLPTNFYYYFDVCSNAVMLSPSGGALASGTVGVDYSAALSASGGSNGYYWQDLGGVPGISLSASGLATNAAGNSLAGTPTTAGTFTATIKLSDWPNWTSSNPVASQCSPATYTFSITIVGPDSGVVDSGEVDSNKMDAAPDACLELGGSCTGDGCCTGLECGLIEMSCCVPAAGQCMNSGDCCAVSSGQAGLTCSNGTCQVTEAGPPEAGPCSSLGADCANDPCCSGLSCTLNGTCCTNLGGSCKTSGDCCGGVTCLQGGTCGCVNSAQCPDPTEDVCTSQGTCCVSAGGECGGAAGECCDGLACGTSNLCGTSCQLDSDCPSGQVCDGLACKASTTKGHGCATGPAEEPTDPSVLVLLGLAVTAGVGLRRRRLRRRDG